MLFDVCVVFDFGSRCWISCADPESFARGGVFESIFFYFSLMRGGKINIHNVPLLAFR